MSELDVADLYRQLGDLNATNRALLVRLAKLEEREELRDAKIGTIYDWMLQARGSWRAMLGAAGFGAAVAAFLLNIKGLLLWARGG